MVAARLIAAAVLAGAPPAAADALDDLCAAGGAPEDAPMRDRVAGRAQAEFMAFRGHVIDFDGRIARFGAVESETETDRRADGANVPRDAVAWAHVWRYWRTPALRGVGDIADDLRVTTYDPDPAAGGSATLRRRDRGLSDLLSGLAASGLPPETRAAATSALIRAAMSDVPWSGAFVSAVMADAGVAADAFAFSGSHIDYIAQAFRASQAELGGAAAPALYRACRLAAAAPRRGDLVCYCREPSCVGEARAALFERVRRQAAGEGGDRVRRTHCDVVVDVDRDSLKLGVVGGNVIHAVTYRRLKLRADGTLSDNTGRVRCHEDDETGAAELTSRRDCSFNARDWFALLQMR